MKLTVTHLDIGAEQENKHCIYLGQLPAGCTETDIDRFFNGYGRLNLILMRNSCCYVFIDEKQDAEDAVKELKGRKIRGEKIILEFLEKGGEDNLYCFPRYQLKIENMSQNTACQERVHDRI